MYESRHQPLITRTHFARRLARHIVLAAGLVIFSLGIGMAGYRYFEDLGRLDDFLNAFYSGLFFLIVAAILFAPVLHRLLHKFHWNERL